MSSPITARLVARPALHAATLKGSLPAASTKSLRNSATFTTKRDVSVRAFHTLSFVHFFVMNHETVNELNKVKNIENTACCLAQNWQRKSLEHNTADCTIAKISTGMYRVHRDSKKRDLRAASSSLRCNAVVAEDGFLMLFLSYNFATLGNSTNNICSQSTLQDFKNKNHWNNLRQ